MTTKKKRKSGLTTFGRDVKKKLLDLDMSHEELAQEVGTSLKYLDHIMYIL